MTITKRCDICKHFPNDEHCIGCEWDRNKKENTKWELEENPIVIERKVLDEIRAEIVESKYNHRGEYNRELAFNICLQIIDKHIKGEK